MKRLKEFLVAYNSDKFIEYIDKKLFNISFDNLERVEVKLFGIKIKFQNPKLCFFRLATLSYLRKTYKDYIYFFFLDGHKVGFGEVVLLLNYVKEIKKQYNAKILIITDSKVRAELAELYNGVDKIIVSNALTKILSITDKNKNCKPPKKGCFIPEYDYSKIQKLKERNMENDPVKLYYAIKNDALKQFADYDYTNVQSEYKEQIEKRKTVMIVPDAVTYNSDIISKEDWLQYADALSKDGYNVIFNSNENYGTYQSLFLGIKETLALCSLCEFVVAYRSGFAEVIASTTKVPIISVLEESQYIKLKKAEEQLLNITYKREEIIRPKEMAAFREGVYGEIVDYYFTAGDISSLNNIRPQKEVIKD